MDPPLHTAYRKYLNPWFSPARSRSYEPFVRSVTTALLDAVIETGTVDLVHDLASPVPALLTARLLGVPLADWRLRPSPQVTRSAATSSSDSTAAVSAARDRYRGRFEGRASPASRARPARQQLRAGHDHQAGSEKSCGRQARR